MTRAFLTALLLGAGLLYASPGCSDQGVGDPCTPEQEFDPTFNGFDVGEVNVESKSFQCRTRVCLVNHFQGRVSCPYGQKADKSAKAGASPCTVPDSTTPIEGDPARELKDRGTVREQCLDRIAANTVYCSCRCADINGQKPSDQSFCDCPDNFTCEPLVTSIGKGNEGLTGSYCVKNGTKYDQNSSCKKGLCDPQGATTKCQ